GGGLVAALQFLAGLDQRQALAGIDAECFQQGGGQHLADPTLQRQPAIPATRPRGAAGALGAEIEQAAGRQLLELSEQEAAAVAEVGIVALELVAVIAQRQRRLEAPRQRLEAAEMGKPLLVRK